MLDSELYELCGLGWRLPIWAKTIGSDVIEVTIPEIPLLKCQVEAATTILDAHKTIRDGKKWLFTKQGLAKCAFKSCLTDPEQVVSWKRDDENPRPSSDFVTAYCESKDAIPLAMFRNPAMFAVIWESICKVMLHFILFREGEVDLGFAKICSVCCRRNWKSIIVSRLVARRRNGIATDSESVRRLTRKLLHRDFITALDEQTQTVAWNLEIVPTKAFRNAIAILEIKRKREMRGSYAFNVLKLLKSHTHKNRMYELLQIYLRQVAMPFPQLPHGFETRFTAAGKERVIDAKAALPWTPESTVNGMKRKDGRVSLTDADLQLSPDDLRRLGDGITCAIFNHHSIPDAGSA